VDLVLDWRFRDRVCSVCPGTSGTPGRLGIAGIHETGDDLWNEEEQTSSVDEERTVCER
jgi:hypothetical protein